MKKTTKRMAIGTVVAAATGYVAGILTAPKSGRETRKDIQKTALKAKKESEQKLKQLHSELDTLIKQGKTKATKLQATAKKELNSAVVTANTAKEKARDLLSAIHEGDAEDKDLERAVKEATKAVNHLKSFIKKHG